MQYSGSNLWRYYPPAFKNLVTYQSVLLKLGIGIDKKQQLSVEIAKAGGLYKCDYGKSHGVGSSDEILAATAEAEKAELKTLDRKHYPMVKGLRLA